MPGNIFQQGMDAFDQSYDRTETMRQQQAAKRAGRSLAGGDRQGAMQAFGDAGQVGQVRQLQADQAGDDEAARTHDAAAMQQRLQSLTRVAQGLKGVQPGQRKAALSQAAPLFQQAGIDAGMLDSLDEDHLSDQSLDMFTGQLAKAAEEYTLAPGAARYKGDQKIAEQPFAPQYRTVGEGQSLVEVGAGQQAPAPAPQGDWMSGVSQAAPDAQVTSGYRSPAHNAEVGGKPNSRHLSGQALDLVPRPGETMGQLYARVNKIPGAKAINEGDHVHVQQASASGGARVIAQGPPKAAKEMARPATAQEKAQYGIPTDVPAQIRPDGSIGVVSGTGARLKPIPQGIQKGYAENNSAVRQIDDAIAAIRANPKALGLKNIFGDEINQRVDPKGINARASTANIGSLIIHDRSGAAVTAAETPRLKPFIPMPTDGAEAAIAKLENLKRQYQNNNSQIEVQYDEGSGYSPLGGMPRRASGAPAAPPRAGGGIQTLSPEQAAKLPPGSKFRTTDGRVLTRK